MRLSNEAGQKVYYNCVEKNNGSFRYVIKAASGQKLPTRDKGKAGSRSFATEAAAERFLKRYGYTIV